MNAFDKVLQAAAQKANNEPSKIEMSYDPKTDEAAVSIKANSTDATLAMIGALIQHVIDMKYLTAQQVVTLAVNAAYDSERR